MAPNYNTHLTIGALKLWLTEYYTDAMLSSINWQKPFEGLITRYVLVFSIAEYSLSKVSCMMQACVALVSGCVPLVCGAGCLIASAPLTPQTQPLKPSIYCCF